MCPAIAAIDYLLLSHLIHKNGMTPPHIAAGANLNMPLIGGCELRRRFFLRRSFKGEPLYAAVFHEYLHLMLARGFPIEYFIEGGRSRTGRTLAPKAGILGMTIASFVRSHSRPLVFVPVYVGYERIIEGDTHAQLAGRPKRKEVAAAAAEHGAPHQARLRTRACEFRRTAAARRLSRRAPRRLAGGGVAEGEGGAMLRG